MTIRRVETTVPAAAGKPRDVTAAAHQFEGILIGQMLKAARSGEGWLGTGEDSAAESAMGLAEEQFAAAMAAQGGIGLARMIADGLKSE